MSDHEHTYVGGFCTNCGEAEAGDASALTADPGAPTLADEIAGYKAEIAALTFDKAALQSSLYAMTARVDALLALTKPPAEPETNTEQPLAMEHP
jgi:hypothetical protein